MDRSERSTQLANTGDRAHGQDVRRTEDAADMRPLAGAALAAAIGGHCASRRTSPAMQGRVARKRRPASSALIEGAKKEGAVTYWDVVIQPRDQRCARRGVPQVLRPAEFVQGELSALGHRHAGDPRRAGDSAPTASRWTSRRSARHLGVRAGRGTGDALEYDSPQYRYLRAGVANGLGKREILRLQRRLSVRADVGCRPAQIQRQILEGRDRRGAGGPHHSRRRVEIGRLSGDLCGAADTC